MRKISFSFLVIFIFLSCQSKENFESSYLDLTSTVSDLTKTINLALLKCSSFLDLKESTNFYSEVNSNSSNLSSEFSKIYLSFSPKMHLFQTSSDWSKLENNLKYEHSKTLMSTPCTDQLDLSYIVATVTLARCLATSTSVPAGIGCMASYGIAAYQAESSYKICMQRYE